jgi:hypothetical protein
MIIYPSSQSLYISIHYYILLDVSAIRGHHQVIYVHLTTDILRYSSYIGQCLQRAGEVLFYSFSHFIGLLKCWITK